MSNTLKTKKVILLYIIYTSLINELLVLNRITYLDMLLDVNIHWLPSHHVGGPDLSCIQEYIAQDMDYHLYLFLYQSTWLVLCIRGHLCHTHKESHYFYSIGDTLRYPDNIHLCYLLNVAGR